jgi:hypothetical protein
MSACGNGLLVSECQDFSTALAASGYCLRPLKKRRAAKLVEVKNTSTNTRKLSANAHAAYRKYWQSNDAASLSVEDAFVAGHIAAARQLA